MTDRTIEWLRGKIAAATPPHAMASSSIATLAALVQAIRAGHMIDGLHLSEPVRSRALVELVPIAEQALHAWRDLLAAGPVHEAAEIALGLRPQPPSPHLLRPDPLIHAALARLFAALDNVERATASAGGRTYVDELEPELGVAYYIEPADPNGCQRLKGLGLPQLEGLYAELDRLEIGSQSAGGRHDRSVADFSVIEPVALMEDLDIDDRQCVTIHHQDMGRILMVRVDDGVVLHWNSRFDKHPRVVASSLASYFEALAASFES